MSVHTSLVRLFQVAIVLASWPVVHLAQAADAPAGKTEDISFVAACDGSTERYVAAFPAGFQPDKPCPLMIALHGHGSDRWQFIKAGRGECSATRDVAAAHGMLLVSPDYRAKTSWMGPKAEADVVQIISDLKSRYRITKVIICGGSMGGTGALTFAALHPELVDGVVSMNGTANLVEYDKFLDAIAQSFGGTKAQLPDEYKKRSAEFWPERLTMPIAVTTGGRDGLVPPQSVLRLAEALKKRQVPVLVLHRETGGHSTNFEDAKAALEFVAGKVLSPAAKTP